MSPSAGFLSLRDASLPNVAVEIAAGRVSAAAVELSGNRAVVGAHAAEPIPPGAVEASLTATNVRDVAAVSKAVARVLEQVGRPRRVGLVVPDPVVKVSLIKLDKVPARRLDLEEVLRWQVKKSAPFPIEEGQMSYVEGTKAADGQEYVVSLARTAAVQEYEGVCTAAGAHAGLVDISTFNVINGVLAASSEASGDWLLINIAPDYASVAILRDGQLMFFRSRAEQTEGSLPDLVHQTTMYYEDRLQGRGFTRAVVCGVSELARHPGEVDQMRRNLEARLRIPVEAADITGIASLTDRIAAAPVLLDTLAPLVGLLVRSR